MKVDELRDFFSFCKCVKSRKILSTRPLLTRQKMSTNYENLIVEIGAPVARVTLNRPDRRNALSLALMRELTACLREIGGSDETRGHSLRRRERLSSGHDLTEMRGRSVSDYRRIFDAWSR